MLFEAVDPSHASGGTVTFEAGARTAWHAHPRGQILIVTAGVGRVQRWGDPIEEMRAGDVVRIPAGQKHWHGASPASSMTHIAISEHRDGTTVQWMEQVSDGQYNTSLAKPEERGRPAQTPEQPSRSGSQPQAGSRPSGPVQQRIAPGLAMLTDDVLFGDVWRRPELSPRDRSLVTISVLIATGKPAQLRGHLGRALDNGAWAAPSRRADGGLPRPRCGVRSCVRDPAFRGPAAEQPSRLGLDRVPRLPASRAGHGLDQEVPWRPRPLPRTRSRGGCW